MLFRRLLMPYGPGVAVVRQSCHMARRMLVPVNVAVLAGMLETDIEQLVVVLVIDAGRVTTATRAACLDSRFELYSLG